MKNECGKGYSRLFLRFQVAYRLVQSRATRSCSSRCCRYCVAILPTNGSAKGIMRHVSYKKTSTVKRM